MTSPSRAVFVAIIQIFSRRLESTKSASCLPEGFRENESPHTVFSSSDFLNSQRYFFDFSKTDFCTDTYKFLIVSKVFDRSIVNFIFRHPQDQLPMTIFNSGRVTPVPGVVQEGGPITLAARV